MGTLVRPDYKTKMDELLGETVLDGVPATLAARRYDCEGTYTYACEIELTPGISHIDVRRVIHAIVCTCGSVKSMSGQINKECT